MDHITSSESRLRLLKVGEKDGKTDRKARESRACQGKEERRSLDSLPFYITTLQDAEDDEQ